MKNNLRNIDQQNKSGVYASGVYYTQFAKTPFSESLKDLKLVTDNKEIITVERDYESERVLNLPATAYKLRSVLFNGSITIDNGTVLIDEDAEYSVQALKDLFGWIRGMDSKKLQYFMENFEITVSHFCAEYPDEASNYRESLSSLQHLSRIVACLIPDSVKIYSDLQRLQDADFLRLSIKNQDAA